MGYESSNTTISNLSEGKRNVSITARVMRRWKNELTEKKELFYIDLILIDEEVHAIMGKNGSGKSTFSKVLVGHPEYEITGGTVTFKGKKLLEMEPEERSLADIVMSFESPVEIPGFFHYVYSKLQMVNIKEDFLNRNVNEEFSGGERKRNEILQLAVLGADMAILDEIDSGLDVDAIQDVAKAVNGLLTPNNSLLMITHYQRLLDYIKPSCTHIMENGRIVRTGDSSLALVVQKEGYKGLSAP